MAGILASQDIVTVNTNVLVYTSPSGKTTTCNVCLQNRGTANILVRVALSTSGNTVDDSMWIEYDATIYPKENMKINTLVIGSAQAIYVRTDTATCNVVLMGFQD